MKGQYKFVQTVHTGPQGSVPVLVKHNYEGAVPKTWDALKAAYLRQAGHGTETPFISPASHVGLLTVRQRRQLRRAWRRAHARSLRAA
jgi:hypothetical protein